MKRIEELPDLLIEMLENIDDTSGIPKFPKRATEIVREISTYAETTPFNQAFKQKGLCFWHDDTPPEEIYAFILQKIIDAPVSLFRDAVVLAHMPALERALAAQRRCRVCGCTEQNACRGGCYWAEEDLCSACVGASETAKEGEHGRGEV